MDSNEMYYRCPLTERKNEVKECYKNTVIYVDLTEVFEMYSHSTGNDSKISGI